MRSWQSHSSRKRLFTGLSCVVLPKRWDTRPSLLYWDDPQGTVSYFYLVRSPIMCEGGATRLDQQRTPGATGPTKGATVAMLSYCSSYSSVTVSSSRLSMISYCHLLLYVHLLVFYYIFLRCSPFGKLSSYFIIFIKIKYNKY